MRVIRRYKNRKLYDSSESRYVNLSELFDFARNGDLIRVVNDLNEDITVHTLLGAVLERDRALGSQLTEENVLKIITAGDGTLADFLNNANEVKNV